MYNFENLVGRQFGLFTVIERAEDQVSPSGYHRVCWKCVDNNGKEKIITSKNLKRGKFNLTYRLHQKSTTKICEANKYPKRLIKMFQGMKARCYNPSHSNYKNYGGRGIKICSAWLKDSSKFYDWAMANGYNPNAEYGECTIDRIDGKKGYSPSNCRWVSMKEQSANLKSNVPLTINGETHHIAEWARILKIPKSNLQYKVKTGKINEILV